MHLSDLHLPRPSVSLLSSSLHSEVLEAVPCCFVLVLTLHSLMNNPFNIYTLFRRIALMWFLWITMCIYLICVYLVLQSPCYRLLYTLRSLRLSLVVLSLFSPLYSLMNNPFNIYTLFRRIALMWFLWITMCIYLICVYLVLQSPCYRLLYTLRSLRLSLVVLSLFSPLYSLMNNPFNIYTLFRRIALMWFLWITMCIYLICVYLVLQSLCYRLLYTLRSLRLSLVVLSLFSPSTL